MTVSANHVEGPTVVVRLTSGSVTAECREDYRHVASMIDSLNRAVEQAKTATEGASD